MFYSDKSQFDKKVNKIIKTIMRYKVIQSEDEIKAILTARVFINSNNCALCTDKAIIYATTKMQVIAQTAIYNFSDITSVSQEDKSITKHYINLVLGGGKTVVLEVEAQKEEALAFVSYISKKIGSKEQTTSISMADEIKKYKELLDMGAITEEEYEAKKKQLLGL